MKLLSTNPYLVLAPTGPTPAGDFSLTLFWATSCSACLYSLHRYLFHQPSKLDFDLSRHPVSVKKARKLYKKLGTRLYDINHDNKKQCEKKCQKQMRPCSILLQLEAMNGGIERRYGAKEMVASAESLDDEMRVLEDCDDRMGRALWKLETKCSENLSDGLENVSDHA